MVSFVYFDLGGVVIQDFSGTNKWAELKKELGISPAKDGEFEAFWSRCEYEMRIGLSAETVIQRMRDKFNAKWPEGKLFLMEGFVNRFAANKSIWPVIKNIHRTCRIGLLTNMYTGMLDGIRNRNLLPDVNWDVIVDSTVVGLQKPDPRIFEFAEQKAREKGKDILFVENGKANVDAAMKFGWSTFLYDSNTPEESSKRLSLLFD